MSKRQIAALAAVVLVPLATLAVVLLSVSSNGGGSSGEAGGGGRETALPSSTGSGDASPTTTVPKAGGKVAAGKRRSVPAPDVSFPVLDGGSGPLKQKVAPAASDGKLALGELHGTPVVLNLWSSWCDPCRPVTRFIQSESERLGRRGVLFLGLDVQDKDSQARRFRSNLGLTYPTAKDTSGDTARKLGATGVPETFFISSDGQIVSHVVGVASLGEIELGVAAAQGGTPVGTRQGGARLPLR